LALARLPLIAKDWLLQGSIGKWRGRIAERTFHGYYSFLYPFCLRVHKSPDELLAWARGNGDQYIVLDAIQSHVNNLTGLRHGSKVVAYAAIRSFFMHNRINLPDDRSFHIHSEVPPVERKISIENLKELFGLAAQPWRSMYLVKWMGLLDTEGLIYVSTTQAPQIAQAARESKRILRLSLPGRKKKRNEQPYYTWIGRDALESVKQYLERDRGEVKQGEALWLYSSTRQPVTKYGFNLAWIRLLRKARLIPDEKGNSPRSRYGFNVHNTRDLAISLLATVPNLKDFTVEFWAGHDIDPNKYKDIYNLQPEFAAKQYELAEPYLNLISASETAEGHQVKTLREEIQELRFAVRMLQDASGLKALLPSQQTRPEMIQK
jgi:hypothetical protein